MIGLIFEANDEIRANRQDLDFEVIASGKSLRERKRLKKIYGGTRWRKLKGVARVRFSDGRIRNAEVHWYEAHGIGKKEIKVKHLFD